MSVKVAANCHCMPIAMDPQRAVEVITVAAERRSPLQEIAALLKRSGSDGCWQRYVSANQYYVSDVTPCHPAFIRRNGLPTRLKLAGALVY